MSSVSASADRSSPRASNKGIPAGPTARKASLLWSIIIARLSRWAGSLGVMDQKTDWPGSKGPGSTACSTTPASPSSKAS